MMRIKNVQHIIEVGSKNTTYNTTTWIHSICESQNIQLTPYWIPRTQNDHADQLSKDHRSRWLGVKYYFYMFWMNYGINVL
jgi:hypothetical protein